MRDGIAQFQNSLQMTEVVFIDKQFRIETVYICGRCVPFKFKIFLAECPPASRLQSGPGNKQSCVQQSLIQKLFAFLKTLSNYGLVNTRLVRIWFSPLLSV